ncbi:MAG: hypothetical protein J2P34_04200, partial [Actinobacteria bacterium]|nr:hypothetical protein [Actinomycetota bacterium]
MSSDDDFEVILRRALHESVESVEPAGDGLQRIRRKLAKPRLQRQAALLLTETADLWRAFVIRLEPAASRTRAAALPAVCATLAAVRPARR